MYHIIDRSTIIPEKDWYFKLAKWADFEALAATVVRPSSVEHLASYHSTVLNSASVRLSIGPVEIPHLYSVL